MGNTNKDGTGTQYFDLCNALGQIIMDSGWSPSLQIDEAANDSDKSFTVPASTEWKLQSIWVEFISSAVAGNRLITVELRDGAVDLIFQMRVGIVQAASLTRYYQLAPQLPNMAAFIDTDFLSTPLPEIVIPASYSVRVYDKTAVDAAADDMVVQMLVLARSV